MKKLEIGTIVTLILAIIGGVFWLGRLDARIEGIKEGETIEKQRKEAQAELTKLIADFKATATAPDIPIGTVVAFGGPLTPVVRGQLLEIGWLPCDGEPVRVTDFPELYELLGSHFGQETDGRRRLPDFRGRVPMGAGQGFSLTLRELGQQVGSEMHTLSVEQLPSHTHTYNRSHESGEHINDRFAKGNSENARHSVSPTGGTGGGQAHPIVQPSLVIHLIIKARGAKLDAQARDASAG